MKLTNREIGKKLSNYRQTFTLCGCLPYYYVKMGELWFGLFEKSQIQDQ